jgi:hypothetical protein
VYRHHGKDAVKLMGMDVPVNLFYLSIEARIEDEDTLMDLLLKKLGTRSPGPPRLKEEIKRVGEESFKERSHTPTLQTQ